MVTTGGFRLVPDERSVRLPDPPDGEVMQTPPTAELPRPGVLMSVTGLPLASEPRRLLTAIGQHELEGLAASVKLQQNSCPSGIGLWFVMENTRALSWGLDESIV